MNKHRSLLAAVLLILFSGCANMVQVKIDVVDQRTALENQVLGSYQEIEGDLTMLASVRAIDSEGRLKPAPKIPEGRKKAIRAMQRSKFNQDDIERFKADGAIGEGNGGYLEYVGTGRSQNDSKTEEFIQNLVTEENEDRKALYLRIVDTNENFSAGDLAKVESIMAGLNRDSAGKGEWIQTGSGKWIQKTKGR